MLSAADNEMLTRTGPQTPMGQYMRHFWQPIALSRELPEPDGARCASTSWAKSWFLPQCEGRGRTGRFEMPAPRRFAVLRPQ
jgi:phthalate 4,5-dioxygenase oxygenase subunit